MWPLTVTQAPGSSLNASGGAAGPSRATLYGGDAFFDSSNWTVKTGGSPSLDVTTVLVLAGLAAGAFLLWKRAA